MTSIDARARREAEQSLPRLMSLDEFVARPAVSWQIRDLLPVQSIVVFFGPAKSGKTHVVVDIAMHAAHGMHWQGYTVTQPLRIAYLAGEGHNGLRVRLRAWSLHHGAELRGDMRVMPQALSLTVRLQDLLAVLRPYALDVLVLDTLNAYFGTADENSTQDMTAFVAALRVLRDELHCSVLVVHHTGLADGTRERGSSVLRAAADVIVQVARDEGGSDMIGMRVVEARDYEPWNEPLSLRLQVAQTDWTDAEGQPIAACLVAAGEAPVTLPGRGGRPLGEAQMTVLTIARELAAKRRNGSDEVLLPRHEISTLAQERGLDRRRVSQSWSSLARRGLVRLVEPASIVVRVRP